MNIDENLKFHDFRIVKGPTHTNIIFDVVVPIKFHMDSNRLKEIITNEFKKIDEKYNTVITIDQDLIGRRKNND